MKNDNASIWIIGHKPKSKKAQARKAKIVEIFQAANACLADLAWVEAKPKSRTKGHHAAHPGLRGHSTGKHYPWSIVGIGGHPHTRWACWHLIDGGYLQGTNGARNDKLDCTFKTYAEAERALDIITKA